MQALFVTDLTAHPCDVLGTLIDTVYDALTSISNNFKGPIPPLLVNSH